MTKKKPSSKSTQAPAIGTQIIGAAFTVREKSVRAKTKAERHAEESQAVAVLISHGFVLQQASDPRHIMFDGKRVASMRVMQLVVPEDSALGEALGRLERELERAKKKGIKP